MRVPSFMTPSPLPPRGDPDALVTPPSLEFYLCRGRYLAIMLLVIPLCAAAYFCIYQPSIKAQVAGWAGLILFPLGVMYGLFQVFQTGPVIVLSHEGIYDRRFGVGVIPWSTVKLIWEKPYRQYRFLCIDILDQGLLRKMPLYMRLFSQGNSALDYSRLTLNFTALDHDIDDALRYIRSHYPQYLPDKMLPPSMRR